MRAARLHGWKDLRIEQLPDPECRPGQVKVRPRFNGICGSDLHAFFDKNFQGDFISRPHPLTGEVGPVGFGHEFSAEVLAVGAGVSAVQPGDLVAAMPIISDGTCDACKMGAINCCSQLGFIGYHGWGGGLSDAVVLREDRVFRLPASVDAELGVEPLAVGWRAVRMARDFGPESTALVIGGGPVGCAVVLALVAKGMKSVIVSEISAARQRIVEAVGASHVLNPATTDILEAARLQTKGRGVDLVFDCAGGPVPAKLSCHAVGAQGLIVNLALRNEVTLDAAVLTLKEASWRSSLAYTVQDFHEVIDALADGKMNPKAMITRRVSLDRVVVEGLEPLHDSSAEHCKVLVDLSL